MAERKFRRYTSQQIDALLASYVNRVRFSEVHVHHTWKPTIADYRARSDKESLIVGMWRYHTQTRGWSDIAQHATVDPDGYIWDGRSLLIPPASATGYNDPDSDNIHPFMFEMIGNFDVGQERLEGAQLNAATRLVAAVVDIWNLSLNQVRFHREMTPSKTCPGSGVEKSRFIEEVSEQLDARRRMPSMPGSAQTSGQSFPVITNTVRVVAGGKPISTGYLINGKTYAQIREIGEALGLEVEWDAETRTASLRTKDN